MRLALLVAAPVLLIITVILGAQALAGPPAGERLAGVTVSITGYSLPDGADGEPDLQVQITVASLRSAQDCLAFALDQAFANRAMRVIDPHDGCIRPTPGRTNATLLFDRLTDDDRQFPSHTIVWGVKGGKCGVVLPLFGVCVVDFAGTVDFELPRPSNLPSFPPLGSFTLPTYDLDGVP
jgi:hypothetical protein